MSPVKFKVTYGGWYQRTTLHLSEIYGFLSAGYSKLKLSKDKLKELQKSLDLDEVTREVGYLEYVKVRTKGGIEIRYYEDGLFILEMEASEVNDAQNKLEYYFENKFNPAISYIFSLGAPTPKILANIKTTHPVVVNILSSEPECYQLDQGMYGKLYSTISAKGITVYKTLGYIFIVSTPDLDDYVKDLVEMQIFFREFKDQLEKYLNIHRSIWEEISEIREKRFVKGKDVEKISVKLEGYQKTINLISSRINQMGNYVHTRAEIAKELKIDQTLISLFRYKFDILLNTHNYIKEIWAMTKEYLSTALEIVREIENKAMNNSIRSIQVLASIGVLSGLVGYLTRESIPTFTTNGIIFFLILVALTIPANWLIGLLYKNIKYPVDFPEKSVKV